MKEFFGEGELMRKTSSGARGVRLVMEELIAM